MKRLDRRDWAIIVPLLLLSVMPALGSLVRLGGLVAGDAAPPETARRAGFFATSS